MIAWRSTAPFIRLMREQAKSQFANAIEASQYSSADLQIIEKARGLRGLGYVAVEQGKLNIAVAYYYQSLQLDPNNERSKQELIYIEQLRQK